MVKVWDLASGHLLRDCHGHTDFVYSLAFSNDSALLASGQLEHSPLRPGHCYAPAPKKRGH